LKLAARYRVPVLEDSTYRELYFSTPPPSSLADLDDQLVISLNTFSKVLAPGLRLGWISAADAIVEQLTLVKQRLDPHTQNLMQMAVADVLDSGLMDQHLTRLRAEHAARCTALVQELQRQVPSGTLRWLPPQGGLYVWGRLSGGLEARSVLHHALAAGVGFVSGEAFYVDGAGAQELRLCFSGVKVHEMKDAVKVLADSIARSRSSTMPRTSMPIV
jgi:2-aminoadipate transaminase